MGGPLLPGNRSLGISHRKLKSFPEPDQLLGSKAGMTTSRRRPAGQDPR